MSCTIVMSYLLLTIIVLCLLSIVFAIVLYVFCVSSWIRDHSFNLHCQLFIAIPNRCYSLLFVSIRYCSSSLLFIIFYHDLSLINNLLWIVMNRYYSLLPLFHFICVFFLSFYYVLLFVTIYHYWSLLQFYVF
jgi:hypothetical protein